MAEKPAPDVKRHTTPHPIRVPDPLWQAYGRVCGTLGTDRTKDVLEHMRARVMEHGTDQDRADLEKAEKEVSERRSRKGGRPAAATLAKAAPES